MTIFGYLFCLIAGTAGGVLLLGGMWMWAWERTVKACGVTLWVCRYIVYRKEFREWYEQHHGDKKEV